jgi:hypothetical protein
MQGSFPKIVNFADETRETQELYGLNDSVTRPFGRQCLVARRLVVWATEFGRTPNLEPRPDGERDAEELRGRDHHIYGFSAWLAGCGIKGGMVHGATDELGFHAAENRHYVTDIHATVLHLLGLDPQRLEIPGRKRLEMERGRPITEIIA